MIDRVFQYRKIADYTIESLINETIYCNKVCECNDPNDSLVLFDLETLTIESLKEIRKRYGSGDYLNDEIDIESIRELYKKNSVIFREIFRNWRISCFTTDYKNGPMWAMYGDNHRGICVEFDGKHEFFEYLREVQYVNKLYKMNLAVREGTSSEEIQSYKEDVDKFMFSKDEKWRYESEYRVIQPPREAFPWPISGGLRAIYFGNKVEENKIAEIICRLKECLPSIKYYKETFNEDNQEICFIEINS